MSSPELSSYACYPAISTLSTRAIRRTLRLWGIELPNLDPLVNVVLIGVVTLTWLMLAIMRSARIK